MPIPNVEEILRDPEISPWLRSALTGALNRDPVDAAADATLLASVLDQKLSLELRQELESEFASCETDLRSVAA